ncbi:MAG: stage V sporulation protein AD [Clostridiales bacterium]|jgi:stage V sporulation protein AD|nr:stage V sporulation protein AD [Clostridiales bacterium]
MFKKTGEQSVLFANPVSILAASSITGPKEGQGPLKNYFDIVLEDDLFGETSWEKAESKFVEEGFKNVVKKAGLKLTDIDYILAGDLLNQSIGSTFGIRALGRPFFGLFGACSTMGEAMCLGAMLIDGGFADKVLAGASSHFCSAERQFRFPLELGTQRPLTSSWTVTGQGAVLLSKTGEAPFITAATVGKIVDLGITDANNMGAAMAPAAADTIAAHFRDTGRTPAYYDLVITGDLGRIGSALMQNLLKEQGYTIENCSDCGIEIFDPETQDTHAGGSGCGCAAVTFSGYLYDKLKKKELNKILFVPTGALMSTTSAQQGESIPGVAHAVVIEN